MELELAEGVMQGIGSIQQRGFTPQGLPMRPGIPFLTRFLGKLVLDIMPAALASLIGGFLFTQYQFGHATPHLATEQVAPASAEMMAMVRDEHAMMMDYLKTQMAAEKSKLAAEDAAAARGEADAKAPDSAAVVNTPAEAKVAAEAPARHVTATLAALKPAARAKAGAVAAVPPHGPLVIAQAEPDPAPNAAAAPADRLASDPDSFLAKTLDLKDHVVAATRDVVSAIGDMFASVGERITSSGSSARQFSSAS
jgi:hypothetical protein